MFVLGTLGLAGGAAAHLRVSPLEAGLIAGLCWTLFPDAIASRRLIWAKSSIRWWCCCCSRLARCGGRARSRLLLAPYLLFRLAGKVGGAWASASLADVGRPTWLAYLMPPGVLAIAFGAQLPSVTPVAAGDTLLSTVAAGTAAFELFALAVLPRWRKGSR